VNDINILAFDLSADESAPPPPAPAPTPAPTPVLVLVLVGLFLRKTSFRESCRCMFSLFFRESREDEGRCFEHEFGALLLTFNVGDNDDDGDDGGGDSSNVDDGDCSGNGGNDRVGEVVSGFGARAEAGLELSMSA